MLINFKNKIKLAPFMLEVDWKEISDNWNYKEMDIVNGKYYLVEIEWEDKLGFDTTFVIKKDKIWLNENIVVPYLNEKSEYEEKKVSEIFQFSKGKKDNLENIKLFRFKDNMNGMNIKIKKNPILNELMKDFSFRFATIKNITELEHEPTLRVDELITKVFLIDEILVISPKFKSLNIQKKNLIKDLKKIISETNESNKKENLEKTDIILKKLSSIIKI